MIKFKGILNSKRGTITDAEQRPAGISGKAFLAGRTEGGKNAYSVEYRPVGGLSPDEGTVSLWVSPVDWDGKDKKCHLFFSAAGEKQQMILYKYHSGDKILFFYNSEGKITALEFNIGNWKPGEFHHLAASWNSNEITLYVDGVLRQSKPLALKAKNPFTAFTVGTLNYWGNDIGKTLIDELKIYDKAIPSDEVAKEYSRLADKTK